MLGRAPCQPGKKGRGLVNGLCFLPVQKSESEITLQITNVSSSYNLQNITCRAENEAGMVEAVAQLNVTCKGKGNWAGWLWESESLFPGVQQRGLRKQY